MKMERKPSLAVSSMMVTNRVRMIFVNMTASLSENVDIYTHDGVSVELVPLWKQSLAVGNEESE